MTQLTHSLVKMNIAISKMASCLTKNEYAEVKVRQVLSKNE